MGNGLRPKPTPTCRLGDCTGIKGFRGISSAQKAAPAVFHDPLTPAPSRGSILGWWWLATACRK